MSTGRQLPLSIVITGVDRLTGTLNRITAGIKRATAPLTAVQNSVAGLRKGFSDMGEAAGVPQLQKRFTAVARAVSGVGTAAIGTLRHIRNVTLAAGGLAYLFKRQVLDTASDLESLQMRLEGLEGGDKGKARASLAFIRRTTDNSPFDRTSVADTFTMMRGFGMDPTKSMQPIIDQVAKLGRSSESLSGIALQLGQAFGKGRLMAQDANILVENGIAVWQTLDRAVERVTSKKPGIAKLRDMSEKGQLDIKYINLLIEQMGIEAKGSAEKMTHSFTGMMTRLTNQWRYFKERVMSGGAFAELKMALQGVLDKIDLMSRNGQLEAWSQRIGRSLLTAFQWLKTDGLRTLQSLASTCADLFHAVDRVAKAFGDDGWGRIIKLGLAAYIGTDLVVAVGKLAAAMFLANGTLTLTPLGQAVIAIGLVIANIAVLYTHWKEFSNNWSDVWVGIIDIVAGAVDAVLGQFGRIERGFSTLLNVVRRVPFGTWAFGAPDDADRAAAGDPRSPDSFPRPRVFGALGPRVIPEAASSSFLRSARDPFQFGPAVTSPDSTRPAVSSFADTLDRLDGVLTKMIQADPSLKVTVDFNNAPPGTRTTATVGPRVDLRQRMRMGPQMSDTR